MNKPTTPPPRSPSTVAAVTPHPGVPLAVWTAVLGEDLDDPSLYRWLTRLTGQYTPPHGKALVLVSGCGRRAYPLPSSLDNTGRQPPQLPVTEAAPEPACADFVVVLAQLHRPNRKDLEQWVAAARTGLRTGARLALVTRSRPTWRHRHEDLVAASVQTATAAGFGYLQHLIIAELPAGEIAPATRPPTPGIWPPLHHTAHLDIPIFQLPATAVTTAQITTGMGAGR